MGEEKVSGVLSPSCSVAFLGPLQAPQDPLRHRRPLIGMAGPLAQPIDLRSHIPAWLAIGDRLGQPAEAIGALPQRPCLRVRH
jgi:hypothetical protein